MRAGANRLDLVRLDMPNAHTNRLEYRKLGPDNPVIGGPDNPVDQIIRRFGEISGYPTVGVPLDALIFLSENLRPTG